MIHQNLKVRSQVTSEIQSIKPLLCEQSEIQSMKPLLCEQNESYHYLLLNNVG